MSPVGQVPTACGLRTAHLPGLSCWPSVRPVTSSLTSPPGAHGLSLAKKVKGLAPHRDGRCQWTGFDKAQPSGNRRMTGTRRGRVPAARPAHGSHPSWKRALALGDGQHWRRAQAHGWRPWGDGGGERGGARPQRPQPLPSRGGLQVWGPKSKRHASPPSDRPPPPSIANRIQGLRW